MAFDPLSFFRRPKATPQLAGLAAYHEARRKGIVPPRAPKPRTKAILLKELADAIGDRLLKKGKTLTREEKLQLLDDNMLDAAVAISERLAKIRDEEDFTLSDTMQMFKQTREYQMSQARIQKIDPKDREKGNAPEGIAGYQAQLAQSKAEQAAEPAPERTTAAGQRDKRHDNSGRPPGQGLAKQQEKIRQKQERLRRQAQGKEPPEEPDAIEVTPSAPNNGSGGAQSEIRSEDENPSISR